MFRPFALCFSVANLAIIPSLTQAGEKVTIVYPREDRAVAAALETPASETYHGEFRDVLAKIANDARIHIIIDEQSLEEYAVDVNDVVDYDVQDLDPNRAAIKGLDPERPVTVGDVLDTLFEHHGVGYVIEDGLVKVKARAAAARTKVLRGYDVSSMTDSSMSVEMLATTVSDLASSLVPNRAPQKIAGGGLGQGDFDGPQPVRVSPYKTMLVCLGHESDQERVAKAIASLRALDSE